MGGLCSYHYATLLSKETYCGVYRLKCFLTYLFCLFVFSLLILQITENLPELIERNVFHKFGRLINNNYKRKMRSLVFTLKHRDAIRNRVLSGEITVEKFVNSSPDQLLT